MHFFSFPKKKKKIRNKNKVAQAHFNSNFYVTLYKEQIRERGNGVRPNPFMEGSLAKPDCGSNIYSSSQQKEEKSSRISGLSMT